MSLKLVSQLSLFGSVMLASLILGYAEGALLPQGLTVPIALVAYYFTEHRKLFSLSSVWANAFGILAIVLAGSELFFGSIEARLLSGAHLLVYLMWIVLFQKKEQRQRWWLITLSLLQVAVGAVLTQHGSYGVFLLVYLFISIWTLSLFWVQHVKEQFTKGAGQFNLDEKLSSSAPASKPMAFAVYRSPSYSQSSICSQPGETWLTWRFNLGIFANICGAIVVSVLFFVLIPRLWLGNSSFANVAGGAASSFGSLTGFTEDVRLGDFGEILESTEKALEVKLFNHQTNEPMDVEQYTARIGYDEPYFRGSVLEVYDKGHWRLKRKIRENWAQHPNYSLASSRELVRQEIAILGLGTDKLFAIHPFVKGDLLQPNKTERSPVLCEQNRSILIVPVDHQARIKLSRRHLNYTIYSPFQIRDYSAGTPPVISNYGVEPNHHLVYTTISKAELPFLTELTDRIVQEGPATETELQRAKRIVAYLRDSGQYSYSLNTSIQDTSIDPVDDFLKNRKSGHCEYYASALTLMLRSAGIPARMVSGFKGGKKNPFSGVFEVEQRHAHAWVEAYVGGEWVEEQSMNNNGGGQFWHRHYANGEWVLLDATPATRESSVQSLGSSMRSWHELRSFFSSGWRNYVVQMNIYKQRHSFYRPLKKKFSEWMESFKTGNANGKSTFDAIKNFLSSPSQWFSLTGGAVSFVLMSTISFCVWLYRRYSYLFKGLWGGSHNIVVSASIKVDFYERFKTLCAAKGLQRDAAETQREFAEKVEQSFEAELSSLDNPNFLNELVNWFYYVRFGKITLQPAQYRSINRMLTQLESFSQTKK